MDDIIYGVYVRPDARGRVTGVTSDAFLDDLTGWVKVDEGPGDRFHHAQGCYLPGPLTDERGAYRYRLERGAILERDPADLLADCPAPAPRISDTDLALAELAGIVAEQQAALIELAALLQANDNGRSEIHG